MIKKQLAMTLLGVALTLLSSGAAFAGRQSSADTSQTVATERDEENGTTTVIRDSDSDFSTTTTQDDGGSSLSCRTSRDANGNLVWPMNCEVNHAK